MSEHIGPLALPKPVTFLEQDGQQKVHSPELMAQGERDTADLLHEADERATTLLAGRQAALDRIADLLLEREALEGAELESALRAAEADAASPQSSDTAGVAPSRDGRAG